MRVVVKVESRGMRRNGGVAVVRRNNERYFEEDYRWNVPVFVKSTCNSSNGCFCLNKTGIIKRHPNNTQVGDVPNLELGCSPKVHVFLGIQSIQFGWSFSLFE